MGNSMKEGFLNRYYSDRKQTLGVFTVKADSELFVCKSLELAWNDNENNISCIPPGDYICKWTLSPRLTKVHKQDTFTYEVLDVPGRSGIRIHSANYFYELLGCIAFGDALKDINADKNLDLIHSGTTVQRFNQFMNKESFRLIITEVGI